jgi:Fe-Mn family superoxide dismutase
MGFTPVNRRAFLTAGCSALAGTVLSAEKSPTPLGIPLKQEPLAFDFAALEPYIDAATLKIHYSVRHAEHLKKLVTALDNVNLRVANVVALMPRIQSLLEPSDTRRSVVSFGKKPGPLPPDIQYTLRTHGGAHVNHTILWRFLAPPGSGPKGPEGRVAGAIQREFGSIENFKAAFTKAALERFGSGWVWLVYRPDGRLVITSTPNEDNPLMKEFVDWQDHGRPILCLDMWEHSYYQKYRSDRAQYVANWWNVVNWAFVSKAYAIVTGNPA